MAFKITSNIGSVTTDPESMFRDLRNRTVEGLMAQQADTLRSYMTHKDQTDLALELPTGSGKTLVGLLIAEWRRRTNQERCVFLCPTRQLVHQVAEQAREKYGINVLDFAGSKRNFSEDDKSSFLNCEAIGIATYSALFNTNPFFDDVGTIVFDDAHAAENYVSSFWSLEITHNNDPILFAALLSLIAKYLSDADMARYGGDDESSLDSSFVNKLPTPNLLEIKQQLVALFDQHCSRGDRSFSWSMIREHLHACHLYYTNHSFLLRPILPPTKSFLPFANANQRVYMSATLGEGGDLERIFGREDIFRVPAPVGWDRQGIGRRFFVFPMRTFAEDEATTLALSWIPKFGRCLVLTPSDRAAGRVRDEVNVSLGDKGYRIFSARDIEGSKQAFTETAKAVAIFANRYDGVDLIGDECRYLIVQGLPEATNLQERFLISRLGASALFSVRIRTRVTQAAGRCTRSATDYAFVVILGEKIHNYFLKPDNRQHLHPEIQAEIAFGIEQSKGAREDEYNEYIDLFSSQGEEWKAADESILETRNTLSQTQIDVATALESVVNKEVAYQNLLWNEHYEEAFSAALDVLNNLGGDDLRGYRALWCYLAGNAALLASASNGGMTAVAKTHYSNAAVAGNALPWLKHLANFIDQGELASVEDDAVFDQLERIEPLLDKFGTSNSKKVEGYFSAIRTGLSSAQSAPFEAAQVKLGALLGFIADNSEEQGAPDPWWVSGKRGIVFEDYTATGDNPVISKSKVIQAAGHPNTLREDYSGVSFMVVFCSHTDHLDSAAYPHVTDLFYIQVKDFIEFAEKSMSVIRELWNSYSQSGDTVWREHAALILSENDLTPSQVFQSFKCTPLSQLKGSGG